jgi:hypothetical protein
MCWKQHKVTNPSVLCTLINTFGSNKVLFFYIQFIAIFLLQMYLCLLQMSIFSLLVCDIYDIFSERVRLTFYAPKQCICMQDNNFTWTSYTWICKYKHWIQILNNAWHIETEMLQSRWTDLIKPSLQHFQFCRVRPHSWILLFSILLSHQCYLIRVAL